MLVPFCIFSAHIPTHMSYICIKKAYLVTVFEILTLRVVNTKGASAIEPWKLEIIIVIILFIIVMGKSSLTLASAEIYRNTLGCPPPSNSHHQGIPINLHLPQLLGGGTTQEIPMTVLALLVFSLLWVISVTAFFKASKRPFSAS